MEGGSPVEAVGEGTPVLLPGDERLDGLLAARLRALGHPGRWRDRRNLDGLTKPRSGLARQPAAGARAEPL